MDETNVLVPNDLYLINQTKPAEVVPQLFLGRVLVQTAKIHVSAGVALLNCQGDLAGNWGRFSPTDFQFLSMQRQLLDDRISVKLSRSRSIQEGQEDTRLLRQYSDRFEGAEVNEIEKFVNGSSGREVPDVNGAAGSGVSRTECDLKRSRRILCLILIGCQTRNRWKYGPIQNYIFTWKLFIWVLYGNPPMVPRTFIPGRPMPSML